MAVPGSGSTQRLTHQRAGASMPLLLLLAVAKVNWTAARMEESRKEGMGKVVYGVGPSTVEEQTCLRPVGWADWMRPRRSSSVIKLALRDPCRSHLNSERVTSLLRRVLGSRLLLRRQDDSTAAQRRPRLPVALVQRRLL
jgi:hypothetical protein